MSSNSALAKCLSIFSFRHKYVLVRLFLQLLHYVVTVVWLYGYVNLRPIWGKLAKKCLLPRWLKNTRFWMLDIFVPKTRKPISSLLEARLVMQFTIAQIAMCKISLLYWSMDSVVVAWRAFDLALYTPSVSRHLQLSWERKYITAQQLTNIGVILKFKQELISTNFIATSKSSYKS